MGQNYGWGGLYENRDCSALIQDVFAGFGLALPRNSRDQAGAGRWVSLEGLTGRQKEEGILREGKPLQTILYMPGHVMLYLGRDPVSGRAVACHAVWGLRTMGWFQRQPGREVLGKVVITSLEPGRELLTLVRPDGLLLERLTGMVLLD
jgi:cell wall-associated NlpC family hydrolase